MMHRVVVPFPCSWDGIHAVDLAAGDVRDFGTMADGLVGMGWIEPIEAGAQSESLEFAVGVAPAIEFAVDKPVEAARRGRKRK